MSNRGNGIIIGFKILDEKEEFVKNLDEDIHKVTLFTTKIYEYFFEEKKVKFFIIRYKNECIDENERCQIIDKMFSHKKSTPPTKKKKKKAKTEPVEKVLETIPSDAKQNIEKSNVKGNARKPKQSDGKNKPAVTDGKVVTATEPETVVVEPEKESSEDEIKLVDTIKPLKEELKLDDCIALYCMDEYHSTLFIERYFKLEYEAGKYK